MLCVSYRCVYFPCARKGEWRLSPQLFWMLSHPHPTNPLQGVHAGECRIRHRQRQGCITRLFWCFWYRKLFRKHSHCHATVCSICCGILPSSAFCVAMSSQPICNKSCLMHACIVLAGCILMCELWGFPPSCISSLSVWFSAMRGTLAIFEKNEDRRDEPLCVFRTEALATLRLNTKLVLSSNYVCIRTGALFIFGTTRHTWFIPRCTKNGRFFIYVMMYDSSTMWTTYSRQKFVIACLLQHPRLSDFFYIFSKPLSSDTLNQV